MDSLTVLSTFVLVILLAPGHLCSPIIGPGFIGGYGPGLGFHGGFPGGYGAYGPIGGLHGYHGGGGGGGSYGHHGDHLGHLGNVYNDHNRHLLANNVARNDHHNDYYQGHGDKHRGYGAHDQDLRTQKHHGLTDNKYNDAGSIDDGFKNVYHKEEYGRNSKFHNRNRDNNHHTLFNSLNNINNHQDGKHYGQVQHGGGNSGGVQDYDNVLGNQYNDKESSVYNKGLGGQNSRGTNYGVGGYGGSQLVHG